MLTNLKWGLAWVSSQFTDKWKDFHQITRATATQGIVLIGCLICFYFAFCDSSERNAYPEASASAKPACVAVQREGGGGRGGREVSPFTPLNQALLEFEHLFPELGLMLQFQLWKKMKTNLDFYYMVVFIVSLTSRSVTSNKVCFGPLSAQCGP